jgi:hypothetical protein
MEKGVPTIWRRLDTLPGLLLVFQLLLRCQLLLAHLQRVQDASHTPAGIAKIHDHFRITETEKKS